MELSIVILCYSAGENIREFASKAVVVAESLTENYEIILVANYIDGVNDFTREIANELSENNTKIKSICFPKRGMMGWDMKTGLEVSTGDYICIIDGDGQFPVESITTCYHKIKNGRYDLVKTYRSIRFDGLYRKIISKVYNMLFGFVFPGLRCRDVNSKPKMITRNAYNKMTLTADDWFIDAEIMLNVRRRKMTFFEFPVTFGALAERPSFVRFSAVFEFLKNLLVYRIFEFWNMKNGK